MRVLLTDGSGLTARQCATRLAAAGHHVEVLSPDPLCLCRFTNTVARLHRVPAFGRDPFGWLDATLAVYRSGRFEMLFPTQEQVAVLSFAQPRLRDAGVATAVPPFSSLVAVQDKISASATLRRLGIPQPRSATTIEGWDTFPAYVKDPIGTASSGVRKVANPDELGIAAHRPFLVQALIEGPLVMCQLVFDHGTLIAFAANERTAEGANGGASHKRSVSLPDARRYLARLGEDLNWHGALSADVILAAGGPVVIDINPRLVEPENAYRSGVDLVKAMVEIAKGNHPATQTEATAGVATHQLLLAVLGAARLPHGRRNVGKELLRSALGKTPYHRGDEELTPFSGDIRAVVPVILAAAATLVAPGTASWFTSGSVDAYALTPTAWDQIRHEPPPFGALSPVLPGRNGIEDGRPSNNGRHHR
jgi:hypothetical protein